MLFYMQVLFSAWINLWNPNSWGGPYISLWKVSGFPLYILVFLFFPSSLLFPSNGYVLKVSKVFTLLLKERCVPVKSEEAMLTVWCSFWILSRECVNSWDTVSETHSLKLWFLNQCMATPISFTRGWRAAQTVTRSPRTTYTTNTVVIFSH